MNPKVVVFKKFINKNFPLDFNIPNWHFIDFDDPERETADAYFQININKYKNSTADEYDFIEKSKKPKIVFESNIFRKGTEQFYLNHLVTENLDKKYHRLGFDHFLRQGKFNNHNSPPDRWNHIKKLQGLEVKDWRTSGKHILLVLQKAGDSTLNKMYEDYGTYYNWIENTINEIRKHTDRPIILRPHKLRAKVPLAPFLSEDNKVYLSTSFDNRSRYEGGKSLEEDFKDAWAVVGYNSNSLVESTLEGIPTFPLSDESVVWDISNKNKLEKIENPFVNIDRTQWCYDAGYMLWNYEEINNGVAWEHLKGVYFK